MRKIRYRRHFRRPRAFSFAEIAASSFLVVVMAILGIDICLLIFACSVNDKAAHDAVRAAAQQPNASKSQTFAIASIKNHQTDGYFIGPITLASFNYNDFGGSAPPAGQCPYVQVATSVDVKLPAPLYFYGAAFTNKWKFTQLYTSPIIKTKIIMP